MSHYILTVRAQDGGVDSKSSTVLVYMNVLDINDNAPVFDPSSYSKGVWENATVGTSILMVSATDIDDGMSSIFYCLMDHQIGFVVPVISYTENSALF